jgi:alkylation response protein AidB-like acyl-CoA dehydrogenase
MKIELTSLQVKSQKAFKAFVDEEIVPFAEQFDQAERVPTQVIRKLANEGYLASIIPKENGGKGMDMITFGLLCQEFGRGSASLLSLLTVQAMVSSAILKWGSPSQKGYWLPRLATGESIAAFGLSEPNVGSDAKSVETYSKLCDSGYLLNGEKKWISWGQLADLFLIIAQCEGKPTAFLVERKTPGFTIEPIQGMLGFKSAMLAKLYLHDCLIREENILGRVGFGFSHVAGSALDSGRYSIACGCVGLAQACLDACLAYTSKRKQGGHYLKDYQLIQQMITDMLTNIKAARLLCYQAGYLKDSGKPDSIIEASVAKYFASKMVAKIANDAVQIHGANGCSNDYPVARYMRDAKIMEIIEGSNQIQQIIISKYAYHS